MPGFSGSRVHATPLSAAGVPALGLSPLFRVRVGRLFLRTSRSTDCGAGHWRSNQQHKPLPGPKLDGSVSLLYTSYSVLSNTTLATRDFLQVLSTNEDSPAPPRFQFHLQFRAVHPASCTKSSRPRQVNTRRICNGDSPVVIGVSPLRGTPFWT
jgi:hypothetical protein